MVTYLVEITVILVKMLYPTLEVAALSTRHFHKFTDIKLELLSHVIPMPPGLRGISISYAKVNVSIVLMMYTM